MGRNNRQRRREKQHRRASAARDAGPQREAQDVDDPRVLAEAFALLAKTMARGDEARADQLLDLLVQRWAGAAASAASSVLHAAITPAWDHGWQPADLVHAIGRKLPAPDRRLLIGLVVADAPAWRSHPHADPAWLGQVDDLLSELDAPEAWGREEVLAGWSAAERIDRVDALLRAASMLARAWHLPILPPVDASPSEWGRTPSAASTASTSSTRGDGADDRVLARVRALLAKAESTEFRPEAEALTAKAQELAARHSIDAALLHTEGSSAGREQPRGRRFHVHDPYAKGKARLLGEVAAANRCRAVWSKELGFSTVFGFPTDLAITDVLYTSLVSQCSTAMVAASRDVDSPRSFRDAFVLSFATHIGDRLAAATAESVEVARVEVGDALLPVLAARDDEVAAAVAAAFPNLRRTRARAVDGRGWAAGRAAAELAHLEVGGALEA
jgi:hypothetical protein